MQNVYHLSSDRKRFISHGMFNDKLNSVGVGRVTGENSLEWEGSAVMDKHVQGSSIMTFTGTDSYAKDKAEFSGTSYIHGDPWFKRNGVVTRK